MGCGGPPFYVGSVHVFYVGSVHVFMLAVYLCGVVWCISTDHRWMCGCDLHILPTISSVGAWYGSILCILS